MLRAHLGLTGAKYGAGPGSRYYDADAWSAAIALWAWLCSPQMEPMDQLTKTPVLRRNDQRLAPAQIVATIRTLPVERQGEHLLCKYRASDLKNSL